MLPLLLRCCLLLIFNGNVFFFLLNKADNPNLGKKVVNDKDWGPRAIQLLEKKGKDEPKNRSNKKPQFCS